MPKTTATQPLKKRFWDELKDYFFITLGCLMYAVAFIFFMLPNQFTPGGVSGISSILYYATGVQVQYWYLGINVFLILGGLKVLGFKFFEKTIYAVLALSGMLEVIQNIMPPEATPQLATDPFMAAILGGCLEGTGLAIVFLNNGSTGGTDVIAAIINKYRNVSLGRILMYLDFIIISCSYFVLRDPSKVVIGYVILLLSMIMLDFTMNSASGSVQFTIISDKYAEIAQHISDDLGRGVTVLYGEGWYSGEDRHVLIVIARRRESPAIFRLIKRLDNRAFVSQSKVVGVYGEGFDRIKD